MRILRWPNKSLTTKAEPVEEVNEEINELMDDMLECMFSSSGLGLAAPQVGVPKRVMVAHVEEQLIVLANPEVEVISNETSFEEEGCLSFPGGYCRVKRPFNIKVTGLDRKGKQTALILNGQAARVVQHEVDHLDGVTIYQRADFAERQKLVKTAKKYQRYVKREKNKRAKKKSVSKSQRTSGARRSPRKRATRHVEQVD